MLICVAHILTTNRVYAGSYKSLRIIELLLVEILKTTQEGKIFKNAICI